MTAVPTIPPTLSASRSRQARKALHLVFVALALAGLAGAAIAGAVHLGLIGNLLRTHGTVIGYMELPDGYRKAGAGEVPRNAYCPEVRYRTAGGRQFYAFLVSQCSATPRYPTGGAIPLDYLAKAPNRPMIDARGRFLDFALAGLVLAALFAAGAWIARPRARRRTATA